MPAGRPRSFDEEEVLDAAIELFLERGYEGASVADLRDRTGVAVQSLYNTFGDKQALYQRVMCRYAERTNDPVVEKLAAVADPIDAVRGYIESWRGHRDAPDPRGCLFVQCLASADPGQPHRDPKIALEGAKRLRKVLQKRLREAADAEQVSTHLDPVATADAILALGFGVAVLSRGNMPRSAIDHAIDQALRMLE